MPQCPANLVVYTPCFFDDRARVVPLPVRWDWVMHVADVTVVIDRNLKNLLMRYNHSQPYTIGSRLRLAGTDAPLYYSGVSVYLVPTVVMPHPKTLH